MSLKDIMNKQDRSKRLLKKVPANAGIEPASAACSDCAPGTPTTALSHLIHSSVAKNVVSNSGGAFFALGRGLALTPSRCSGVNPILYRGRKRLSTALGGKITISRPI